MAGQFADAAVVVTGGGAGIGRATAIAFARQGARVVIGNRDAARGAETVALIAAAGGTARFVPTDVTRGSSSGVDEPPTLSASVTIVLNFSMLNGLPERPTRGPR